MSTETVHAVDLTEACAASVLLRDHTLLATRGDPSLRDYHLRRAREHLQQVIDALGFEIKEINT